MSETVIDGLRLSLLGPESLPLAVVRRDSPAYDGPRGFFTVALKNESGRARSFPFNELQRHVVLVYRNPALGTELIDNRTPPPRLDGAVAVLAAGGSKSFQVVFEYPARIATADQGIAVLQFCVKWESAWLRRAAYAPGAYDWNASFQLCREIRIVDS